MTDLILMNPIPAAMAIVVAFWALAEHIAARRADAARIAVRARDRRHRTCGT